ncbi:hypothetical protein B9479_004173 [Cryptococcus floricola]|uniref:Uncharacterized protein n=1 Tax=Cryptococcus floricola TaxID=2591691 RepID=A0A5D3AZ44_9TREE|nr:hypothetical protein B9479_004173 [Cryptococcus floricola]
MSFYLDKLTDVEDRPDEAIKVEYTYSGRNVTSYLRDYLVRIDHLPQAYMVRDDDTNAFTVCTFVERTAHIRSHWDWMCYTAPCESLGEFGDTIGFHPKTSMVPLSEVPVNYDARYIDWDARYEDEEWVTAAETEQAPEEEGDEAEEKSAAK